MAKKLLTSNGKVLSKDNKLCVLEEKNTLKNLLDNTKSAAYLFNNYSGDNLNDLIQYNDTENVEDFSYMFQSSFLKTFPLIDTSNGTNFNSTYRNNFNGKEYPAINVSKGSSFQNMYYGSTKATSILMYGMKVKFDVSSCTLLEAPALVTILSNCQVITSTKTLTLGSTLLAKLEGVYVKETGVEQYEGITCRPCVICESTDSGAMLATDYITSKGWTLA